MVVCVETECFCLVICLFDDKVFYVRCSLPTRGEVWWTSQDKFEIIARVVFFVTCLLPPGKYISRSNHDPFFVYSFRRDATMEMLPVLVLGALHLADA